MKKVLVSIAILLMALAFTSTSVFAFYPTMDPWTMFRHNPSRTGTTSSPAPDTDSLLWTSTFTYTHANLRRPVVAEGKAFILDYTVIKAVDETTGVQLWNSIAFPNALKEMTYANGRLYVSCQNGYIYCVDSTTGDKIWEYQATSTGQVQNSPVVVDGTVYFGTTGTTDFFLYALDASTGIYKWRFTAQDEIWSSPTIDEDLLFFGDDTNRIYALNISASLPALKWYYDTGGRVRGTIAVEGDRLFIGTYTADHAVLAINKLAGTLIWKYVFSVTNTPIENSVAVADGIVYVIPSRNSGDNKIVALYADAPAGTYTETDPTIRKWSKTIGYGGSGYGSAPVVADGKVFFTHYGGDPIQYRVSALNLTDSSEVWSYAFAGAYVGEPIIADGRLFVIRNKYLHCFGSPYPPVDYSYPVSVNGHDYTVLLTINATPSTLSTSSLITLKKISYTLEGIGGTTGMSNITIPNEMLGGPYTVTVDGGLPQYSAPPVSNGTHTSLYFTYLHSVHTVEIIGSTVIPEFSLFFFVLPLFAIGSLLAAMIHRRKH